MKIALNIINKNPQGTNSGRDKTEIQINDLEHRKKKAFNQNIKKIKELKKNENSLRSLLVISKYTNF